MWTGGGEGGMKTAKSCSDIELPEARGAQIREMDIKEDGHHLFEIEKEVASKDCAQRPSPRQLKEEISRPSTIKEVMGSKQGSPARENRSTYEVHIEDGW